MKQCQHRRCEGRIESVEARENGRTHFLLSAYCPDCLQSWHFSKLVYTPDFTEEQLVKHQQAFNHIVPEEALA